MTRRTKILSFLLFLLMLGSFLAILAISNDVVDTIASGILAGFALRSAADRMAVTFTRPAARGGEVPAPPTRTR